jgi:hypothetical protein
MLDLTIKAEPLGPIFATIQGLATDIAAGLRKTES